MNFCTELHRIFCVGPYTDIDTPCRALGIRPNSNKGHEIGLKGKEHAMKANGRAIAKNTICLWYDKDAEAAARFYAETFPDSTVRPPCAQ